MSAAKARSERGSEWNLSPVCSFRSPSPQSDSTSRGDVAARCGCRFGCSRRPVPPLSGLMSGRKERVAMKFDYSIVRQDRFIEATRDSGYKGTDSALSELIDNSIQARATSVAVEFISVDEEMDGPGRPKMPRV